MARTNIKRLVPLVEVPHDPVDPEFRRRMRPLLDLAAEGFLAVFRTPDLCPAKEEALVAGEAIDHRRLFCGAHFAVAVGVQAHPVSFVRHRQPAKVTHVLAKTEAAVDTGLSVIKRTERIVLSNKCIGEVAEVGFIFREPLVAQHAVAIRLRSLIIETMAHFVPDHAADGAVIDSRVS